MAQPLLDLLGRTTAFFIAHRADRFDLVLFALSVCLAPPLVSWAIVRLARPLPLLGRGLERGLWGLLTALLGAQWAARLGWGLVPSLGLALALGIACAVILSRSDGARTLARWLGALAWIFPLLFLFVSPARKIGAGPGDEKEGTSTLRTIHAVVMVFDEFPLVSLLNADEGIDDALFPNFAALAETSTWYRNATTVAQSTAYAVPAILSGRYPPVRKVSQPVWMDYKKNLFTAVGRRGNLQVIEAGTRLCPSKLCSGEAHLVPRGRRLRETLGDASAVYLHQVTPKTWRRRLPEIGETWRDFWDPPDDDDGERKRADEQDPAAVFARFVEQLSDFPAPALHYAHLMTPHLPWTRLPDGTRYRAGPRMPHGLEYQTWRGTPWQTLQGHQRHLLQVGWVDTLVGRLRAELERLGVWRDTLLVVTSDHGTAFETGGRRRNLTESNFVEIVNVPLFIKYPGQERGTIDDSNVETVDVMPTVLSALGAPVPPNLRGHDLSGPQRRETKRVYHSGLRGYSSGRFEEYEVGRLGERTRAIERKIERFGTAGWQSLFVAGPHAEIVGRPLAEIRGAGEAPTGPRVRLDDLQALDDVDLEAEVLPVHISGWLQRDKNAAALELAVAVNGTVRATTETYLVNDRWRFAALIPKSALAEGSNSVEILRLIGSPGNPGGRRLIQTRPPQGRESSP